MIKMELPKNPTISDIELIQTCFACPEQYEAFIGELQVGYLRMRHGKFRVDYPDCGGETIYTGYPYGDGLFNDDERERYLKNAKKAIIKKLKSLIHSSINTKPMQPNGKQEPPKPEQEVPETNEAGATENTGEEATQEGTATTDEGQE